MYENEVKSIAAGDNSAFEALYLAMKREVFVYALSFTADTHLAEDIMQDVFVKVRRFADKFSGGNGRAWVYTITRNTALNALRDRHQTASLSDVDAVAPAFDERGVDRVWLDGALAQLDENQRAVVLLHLTSGYHHVEVAELLGLPLSTVKYHYRTALRRLKSIME